MTKRTYNPEDYSPETQAAMKEILGSGFDWGEWRQYELDYVAEIAQAIEKAVMEAKKVTEDEVRAACAAVAEAHLSNKKGVTK